MRVELFQLQVGEEEGSELSVGGQDDETEEETEVEGPAEECSPSTGTTGDLYLSSTPNPLPDLQPNPPNYPYLSSIFETVRNNPALACLLLHSIPENFPFLPHVSSAHSGSRLHFEN